MNSQRSAGFLLHPTSLPGKYGIGDLGKEAYWFVDFLKRSGQNLWQVFPIGPTGYGDSPYQCFSAFAGNPLLISPELLKEDDLLSDDDFNDLPNFDPNKIDYGHVIEYKHNLLKKSFLKFKKRKKEFENELNTFIGKNNYWLEDFVLFMAAKDYHGGELWTKWTRDISIRENGAIEKWRKLLSEDIFYHTYLQFMFDKQWTNLKNYANENNIKVIGDLPIFIAYDSADLWSNKKFFTVDSEGKLLKVAGVPPDYFSETGQLWGNPLYNWEEMEKNNFDWWVKRFSKMFELFDIVRIDHFRGFDAYWEIPGDAETAINGQWVKAPGMKLFEEVNKKLNNPPILAEDLGVITDSVVELRDKFNFPGMKILQFAFGSDGDKNFLPHNFIKNCVVYTGSHDNDTTSGFFEKAKHENNDIYNFTLNYLNSNGSNICYDLIKTAYASVANFVIIPLQDILNLGSESRMNFPGKFGGNWIWRFTWNQLSDGLADHYKFLTELYERPPKKKAELQNNLDDKNVQ